VGNEINPKDLYEGVSPSGIRDVFGWNSRSHVFARLIGETKPNTIIEVGTWLGASAINMAEETRKAGLETKIYCVDTWLGAEEFWTRWADTPERDLKCRNGLPQVYFDFLSNVVEHGVQDMIVPVTNTSHIGSMILKHRGVEAQLIYIDGSHEYEDVRRDIQDYMPILTSGGVMFGDDMGWKEVREAVEDSLGESFEMVEDNFWVFRKE